MGWTAHYQFLRAQPLSIDEIAALAALNLESATSSWDGEAFGVRVAAGARADGVLAEGWNKLAMGESDDAERLEDMLTRALAIAVGAEIRIVDDFGAFGWDAAKRCFSSRHATPAPLAVNEGELVDPKTLAPPPLPELPARVTSLLAMVAGGAAIAEALDDEAVAELLGALPGIEGDDPRRPAILRLIDQSAPDRVVTIGFRDYADLATSYDARAAIEARSAGSTGRRTLSTRSWRSGATRAGPTTTATCPCPTGFATRSPRRRRCSRSWRVT